MTVHEIVENYLKANGFDGLAGDNCGCQLGDLFPCCESSLDCVPACKKMWDDLTDFEKEAYDDYYDWVMIPCVKHDVYSIGNIHEGGEK